MPTRLLGLVSVGALAFGFMASAPVADAAGPTNAHDSLARAAVGSLDAGRYIVLLRQPAAASYTGGIKSYAATSGRPAAPFRADSRSARAYSGYLTRQQDSVARSVGATPAARYTVASNGFSAVLSAKQAAQLSTSRDVLALVPVEARSVEATNTADFLGLTGTNGVWAKHGGQKNSGSGIVVGDLDTGIWPESASFTGKPLTPIPSGKWGASIDPLGNTTMRKADGTQFNGACELGEEWADPTLCSTKIIGARYYADSFLASVPPEHRPSSEFISTRDGGGHGSHTASTAAGNPVDGVTVDGVNLGSITGMAPGASIAAYKVCWEDDDPNTGGCYTDAIMSAIDDAVRDGVDVLNFSISGATDTVVDPVEIAFAGAANAGVFVAASAGNSGPTESTVAHNSPWLTTVASTTYRTFDGTVVLGNGEQLVGSMISPDGVGPADLVDSSQAAITPDDATVAEATICGPDSLDPAVVEGTIVTCLRGKYARVDKSAEVARAGGIGMVLANPSPNSINADFHSVPTVHLNSEAGSVVYDYLGTDGSHTATLVPGNLTSTQTPVPQISGFSSRGPAVANQGDILKPDIGAPGSDVLAAVAPPSNSGRDYDLYSGTSMAAPHITGLGAFLLSRHPDWTPQMLQSAMMTTATSLKNEDGTTSSDAFAQGAGLVNPKDFFHPGLFITSTPAQWYGLITEEGYDTGAPAVDPKKVNIPSYANSQVVGEARMKRSLTFERKGAWKVSVDVPGFKASGTTMVKSKMPGKHRKLVVIFTAKKNAELSVWHKGFVTLTGPTTVRLPIALKPVRLAVPQTLTGAGTDSFTDGTITSGFTGSQPVETRGLAMAQSHSGEVATNDYAYECYPVGPGSTVARFDLDADDDTSDLDMTVYAADSCDPNTAYAIAGSSATGSADESVTVENPDAPTYIVEVAGFAAGDLGAPMAYRTDLYDVNPSSDLGELTVSPNPIPVTAGSDSYFTVSWSGLDPDQRYLGFLDYTGTDLSTAVEVTTFVQ